MRKFIVILFTFSLLSLPAAAQTTFGSFTGTLTDGWR